MVDAIVPARLRGLCAEHGELFLDLGNLRGAAGKADHRRVEQFGVGADLGRSVALGIDVTKTIANASSPCPSVRRSWARRASVVGQTSGQWVKPKKMANGRPANAALLKGLPSSPTRVNGPPIEASGKLVWLGAGKPAGGRISRTASAATATSTSPHRTRRTRPSISAHPARRSRLEPRGFARSRTASSSPNRNRRRAGFEPRPA